MKYLTVGLRLHDLSTVSLCDSHLFWAPHLHYMQVNKSVTSLTDLIRGTCYFFVVPVTLKILRCEAPSENDITIRLLFPKLKMSLGTFSC